jgi:hypothetical protein
LFLCLQVQGCFFVLLSVYYEFHEFDCSA